MPGFRHLAALHALPVWQVIDEFLGAVSQHGTAIVVAPPGAGKTTSLGLAMLDAEWLGDRRIVMLEPRRLAARAAAQRMAALTGTSVGDVVGYQTRDERRIGPNTRLEVVTEGVLTRRLQSDPTLGGVGAVLFDEVHERNVPTDLGLALALDCRALVRDDLRIVAMSATPDVRALRGVLGDARGDVPVIESDGRLHPVEVVWAPPGRNERTDDAVAALVVRALREQVGDLLVFLPGIGEIRRVEALLVPRLDEIQRGGSLPIDLFALAGALSTDVQDAALVASSPGRRRVVLSTDIAESSLTVAGVRVVVDAGLARVPRFDPATGMSRLTTVATSRASADQRAGRAGRTEPGTCYRLWSKLEHATRLAHLPAEITEVDLAGLVLELAVWGTPLGDLRFIDPPPAAARRQATDVLVRLGALTTAGAATDVGARMVQLPVHPRLARMIVDATAIGHGALACVIATLLEDRDIMRGSPDQRVADIAVRVGVVTGSMSDDRVGRADAQRVRGRALDLARRANVGGGSATDRLDNVDTASCGLVLGFAYPDRLASRRIQTGKPSQPGQFQLRGGSGAWMAADDPLANEQFIIVADVDGKKSAARVRQAAAIDALDVARLFADDVEYRSQMTWDKQRNDLVMTSEIRLGALLLDQRISPAEPNDETTTALVDRVRHTRLGALASLPDAASLRRRVALVRRHRPDGTGASWPDWSDAALVESLDVWLAPFLVGATGRADLDRLDVTLMLSSQLGWERANELERLAPRTIETPSGRQVHVDYTNDPMVAVRVQDMFGENVHPTVLNGAVPIVLQLLSPADRPLQTTSDLPGFWKGSWADVRRDMAGRYPKHHWPLDPAAAPPQRINPNRS